jgi:hypothetical protein
MTAEQPLRYYVATPADSPFVHARAWFRTQFIDANANAPGMTIADRPETADIIVLFEAYSLKLPAYVDELLRCTFVSEFAERIFVINYDDTDTAFLPGCYTSLTPRTFDPLRHRASCYPKTYNQCVETIAAQGREWNPVWRASFRGAIGNAPVRRSIRQHLSGVPGFQISDPAIEFHAHDQASQLAFLEEIAASEFVLCPRGKGPASYRMFETMQMGRCPVIISDDWQAIHGIDWPSCSIRIREREVPVLPQLLADRRADARRLGETARAVWQQFFEDSAKFRLYARQLAQLHAGRVNGGENIDSLRQRWISHAFRWQRGWTMPQRLWRAPRRAARIVQSLVRRPAPRDAIAAKETPS